MIGFLIFGIILIACIWDSKDKQKRRMQKALDERGRGSNPSLFGVYLCEEERKIVKNLDDKLSPWYIKFKAGEITTDEYKTISHEEVKKEVGGNVPYSLGEVAAARACQRITDENWNSKQTYQEYLDSHHFLHTRDPFRENFSAGYISDANSYKEDECGGGLDWNGKWIIESHENNSPWGKNGDYTMRYLIDMGYDGKGFPPGSKMEKVGRKYNSMDKDDVEKFQFAWRTK
jgi:hypothetical protein